MIIRSLNSLCIIPNVQTEETSWNYKESRTWFVEYLCIVNIDDEKDSGVEIDLGRFHLEQQV